MKKLLFVLQLGLLFSSCENNDNLCDYVNPLIGTDTWKSDVPVAGHEDPSGYTFPLVTEPFGMTEWLAHTMPSKDRGTLHDRVPYWYKHNYISGFLGSHYPSGAVMFDYGAVEVMPIVGKLVCRPEERSSSYSHEKESARPELYQVKLDDYDINVKMSATKTSGIMEFTFPKSDSAFIIVDAMPSLFTAGVPSEISILPESNEIIGKSGVSARAYRTSGYFVIKFDKDIESYGTFSQNMDYPEVIEEEYLFTEKDGKLVNGLKGVYTQSSEAFGELKTERIDPVIDFNWDWYKPADDFLFNNYNVTWTGKLKAPVTGKYSLGLQADDGARLYINDKLVLDDWSSHSFSFKPSMVEVELVENKMYDIKVEYYQKEWSSKVKLSWIKPDEKSRSHILFNNTNLTSSSKIGAYVGFKTSKDEKIKVLIGTSFISVEQARKNLEREMGNMSLDEVSSELAKKWNKELSRIELPKSSLEQKQIFYTSLFHSLLLPRSLSENNKYRSPYDGQIYEGETFTDYSLWDTFRATHPLLTLLKPEFSGHLITGLLNGYKEGGWMPKWPNPGYTNCMMGTHGDAVIADAYVKGVENFDIKLAEEAMMKNAYEKGNYMAWGRLGIEDYCKLGYVPTDKYNESVARTMEFAYDDYCIAQFLSKKDPNDPRIDEFNKRSKFFKNVFDDETKMVRGKNSDGKWCNPDDYAISVWTGFTPRGVYSYKKNYTLFTPHAVDDLIDFLGGKDSLSAFLDEMFNEDMYYVGDEFVMHAPYLYNYCDKHWITQKKVRDIVNNYYLNTPSGLPGNDDCGQMSSWYIFSTLGFYPFCPGNTTYQLTSPSVPYAIINLENGNKFEVKVNNYSSDNCYIQKVLLNGEELLKLEIDHYDILKGGVLEFYMSDRPNLKYN